MAHKMYIALYSFSLVFSFCYGNDISISIMERLAALEQKDSELIKVVEKLAVSLHAKDSTIELLSTEVQDLKARIVELETAIQRPTKNDLLGGKSDVDKAEGQSRLDSNPNVDNFSEKQTVNSRRHQRYALQGQPHRIVRQSEVIAFHAVNDKAEIPNIGVDQNIVFETILLNLGNGYHQQHGVFIAPTTGVYIFSASILSYNNNQPFDIDLVKNGVVLAKIYGYGPNGYYDQGSATVITHLNSADEVWLKLECCANESLYGGRYTTFTGAMLVAG